MSLVPLTVGELTAYLTVDNDQYKRGLRDARTDLTRFGSEVGRDSDRIGRDSGGKLAQGMRQSVIRNSPLIAAAVGGALAAGAPVAIAGATTLFGGIGAVAAAQSVAVRSAWSELGREIRDGAVADAAILVPVYTQMADQIGEAFQEMRPQLRDAFAAVAPQIATVTDGLIGMAQNAMPGLVRAVERSGPVMDGLASLLEDVGSGLGGFFDAMSDNAPAAGEAFAAIGDILGDLLPTLGELLGQGAELAADVLPAVAAATGLALDVVEALGPALPAVVIGFTGMKIAGSVAPMVATLAQNLAAMSYGNSVAATAAGRASTVIAGLGRALPIAALGLAAWNIQTGENTRRVDEWSQTLINGGGAADVLAAKADAARNASFWEQAGGAIFFQDLWDENWSGNVVEDFDAAEAKAREYLDSLSPLERAQHDAGLAQEELTRVVAEFGPTSGEARIATYRYQIAAGELERQEEDLELAVDGVTSAMIEQADQALAAIDSSFNYRRSTDQLEDAQANLAETVRNLTADDKNLRTTQEDVERAQLDLEEQAYRTALAYGQQQADLSGLDRESSGYARTVQTEMLRELYRLHDAAGPEMRGAIAQQIQALRDSGVQLDRTGDTTDATRRRVDLYRGAVERVPLLRGTRMTADTAQANRNVDNLQRNIDNTRGKTVTVQVRAAGRFVLNPSGGLQEFAEGGYTGPGGKHQPAGVVHAGEVVWSQDDVRAHGGPHKVDEMRKFRGYADGGIVLRHDTRPIERTMEQVANAMKNATPAAPALGSGYVTPTVAGLFGAIKAAFPRAKLNSGFRFGDPGYHGLGRAVDLGEAGFAGGAGRPYLAQMAAWIYRNFGKQTRELIYTGLHDSTPDLKNGRPLNYGAATNAAHRNHVHWAMDTGGLLGHGQSATNLSGRPERVLDPRQTEAFERAMDRGWSARGGDVHIHISGVMDLTNRSAMRRLGDVVFDRIRERERELH